MLVKHKIEIAVIVVLIAAIAGVVTWTVIKLNVVNESDLVADKTYSKAEFLSLVNEGVPVSKIFFENVETVNVTFYGKIDAEKLTELNTDTFLSYVAEAENSCFSVLVNSSKAAARSKYDNANMVETGTVFSINGNDVPLYMCNGTSLVAGYSIQDQYAVLVEASMNATFTVDDVTYNPTEYIELIFSEFKTE